MKKILFLSLLASAMLFAACGDTNDEASPKERENPNPTEKGNQVAGEVIEKGGVIRQFYEPDTLDIFFDSPSKGYETTLFFIFLTRMDRDGAFIGNYWWAASEQGKEYEKYYGDTTFSGFIVYGLEYEASAMPLNSINITANKDFDTEHPAGSSLNDIFTLEYASVYNLIQSGYDESLNISRDGKYQTMPLSELESLSLLQNDIHLLFNKLPEKLGTYEFTITVNYGKDPISGREAKVAPAVVKAEFTEKDYVTLPKDKK